jgi:putative dehydrogenase
MALRTVGVIGLGSMGLGMARNILDADIPVKGYDVFPGARTALTEASGQASLTATDAATGVDVLLLMVVNAAQAEDVLFGGGNAAASMTKGATVMLCSTVAPSEARALGERVIGLGLEFLDAPVSGGKVGAEAGTLTLMCSGSEKAFDTAGPILKAISKTVHDL